MPDRVNAPFARRPGYSTAGASISLGVNQFRVEKYGTGEIYQFDVRDKDLEGTLKRCAY